LKPDERVLSYKFHQDLSLYELVPKLDKYYTNPDILKLDHKEEFDKIKKFIVKRFEVLFKQKIDLQDDK
jgi:hypothetical protein